MQALGYSEVPKSSRSMRLAFLVGFLFFFSVRKSFISVASLTYPGITPFLQNNNLILFEKCSSTGGAFHSTTNFSFSNRKKQMLSVTQQFSLFGNMFNLEEIQ